MTDPAPTTAFPADPPATQDVRAHFARDPPGLPPQGLDDDGAVRARGAVPGFEIQGALGRGRMGVVYNAPQIQLARTVALKMIRAGAHADPRELVRFRTEAEAVARLRHENIVQ